MLELSITDTRADLAAVINRVAFGRERVVLTRRGKKLAAVIPVEDLELLEALEDQQDLAAARSALNDPQNRERIPWEKIKADIGL